MNTPKGRMLMGVVIIAVAISASAFAQSSRMSATIPFDFYVSDRLLPAGTYMVAPQASPAALRLFDDRGNSVFVMTSGSTENRAINLSRLVFRRYGDASFLAGIYWQGYKTGRELASSKIERKIAANVTTSTPVAIQLK